MLPQSAHLPPRRETKAQIVHTAGQGLTNALVKADATVETLGQRGAEWFARSGQKEYAHLLIGPAGDVHELAALDRVANHARGLDWRYGDPTWRQYAKPLGEDWQKHGRDPDVVYDWWIARWGTGSPRSLQPGTQPNQTTVAIDLLPAPDGTYPEAQLRSALDVLRANATRFGLPFDRRHVLGHEDVDPCRRGTVRRKGRIVGVPWDPGESFWKVVREDLA